ncbi:MAG: FMN-binding protein [Acidobacteria bacterium]|nr:FMN-binding protein [Acidobacteriota bacterium]
MPPEQKATVIVIFLLGIFIFHAPIQSAAVASYGFFREVIQVVTGEEQRHIREIFPEADAFSSKGGDLPHYKAYKIDPQTNQRTLVGFVFFTTDVEPRERGYEGPIEIAVAMNTKGMITQIKVVENHEPYGYFSIDQPRFAAQFRNKSILDSFRIRRDIDAVTRATISVASASRVIRKSARRIARLYLVKEDGDGAQ